VGISGNDIPGQPFDYDLNLKTKGTNPNYRSPKSDQGPHMSGGKKLAMLGLALFGLLCFGLGVSVGSPAAQEPVNMAPSMPVVASPAPQTVTVDRPVPTYPASCTMAFDTLSKLYPDLEIVIDSSQKQITINNQAYVAITSKDTAAITKATSDQYELKRSVSHSTLQLQDMLTRLQAQLDQCKVDLGR